MERRAVFLDRDGTLNEDSPDYVRSLAELRIFPGVGAALAPLHAAGFELVVVTNQSGLARGYFSPEELARMHGHLRATLAAAGAPLLDVLHCPHHPDERCECRKPLPGLIATACARHGIDAARSFMVGDKESDVAAGAAAGCRTVLVGAARPSQATWVVRDLAAAARAILAAS